MHKAFVYNQDFIADTVVKANLDYHALINNLKKLTSQNFTFKLGILKNNNMQKK